MKKFKTGIILFSSVVFLLGGYSLYRNQSIVVKNDESGKPEYVLNQFGLESTLIPDPLDPSRFVVQGNSSLDTICEGISNSAKFAYSEAIGIYERYKESNNSKPKLPDLPQNLANEPVVSDSSLKKYTPLKKVDSQDKTRPDTENQDSGLNKQVPLKDKSYDNPDVKRETLPPPREYGPNWWRE